MRKILLSAAFAVILSPLTQLNAQTIVNTVDGIDFTNGVFILSEGSNGTNSKLSFIDYTTFNAIDGVYEKINNEKIGFVPQSMFIANNKIYIINQNYSTTERDNKGKLLIADARTLKKIEEYGPIFSTNTTSDWTKTATNITVIGDNIYLSTSSNGLYLIKESTKIFSSINGTSSTSKLPAVVIDSKLFVISNNNILVIEGENITQTINIEEPISGLVRSYDNNLWVATESGNVYKYNATSYSIMDSHGVSNGLNTGWGVVPSISATGNDIYYANNSTTIYKHSFTNNTSETVTTIPSPSMYYNSLGADALEGHVVYTTLSGYGTYTNNTTYVYKKANGTLNIDNPIIFSGLNAFPAGVFFTNNYKSDLTTGISTAEIRNKKSHENNIYYDLQGRRVNNPTKGIYILNGKKVIFK